jgi:gluconokinase
MTQRIVIMGVAGSGKSAVGAALSRLTGLPYRDGDDLHPEANIAKMRAGTPLNDADRAPWLDRVAAVLRDEAPLIVGCSALKRAYRDRIRAGAGKGVVFVFLKGERALIEVRMARRTGHFMPVTLLDSQFAALEPPGPEEAAVAVSIDGTPEEVAREVERRLAERSG